MGFFDQAKDKLRDAVGDVAQNNVDELRDALLNSLQDAVREQLDSLLGTAVVKLVGAVRDEIASFATKEDIARLEELLTSALRAQAPLKAAAVKRNFAA